MKQQEKQYQIRLTDFIAKNPSASEKFYIKNRIKDLKAVLKEWNNTADFNEGEELDGSEFINGVLTVTKTGTASDYFYFDNELKFLKQKRMDIKEPQQPEAVIPDEVLKNPHDKIFKNDFAFTLFDKMKGYYSDTHTPQADYSFLFDIMQKEGFVICTGTKFIDFIKDFDISITKIDSSKTGNKRKTTLYNATKENLQKKHGLSTM